MKQSGKAAISYALPLFLELLANILLRYLGYVRSIT